MQSQYDPSASSGGTLADANLDSQSGPKHILAPASATLLTPDSLVDDTDPVAVAGTHVKPNDPAGAAAVGATRTRPGDAGATASAAHRRPLSIMTHPQPPVQTSTTADDSADAALPAIPATPASAQGRSADASHRVSLPQTRDSPGDPTSLRASPHPSRTSPVLSGGVPDRPQHPGSSTVSRNEPTVANNPDTSPPAAPGHDAHAPATNSSSPLTEALPPLRTSFILPESKILHPKPISLPLSAGNTSPLPAPHSRHSHHQHSHLPDRSIRSSAFVGNVAQLEATAERLSTGTSSIDDAIRELHGELKSNDSRRSSILDSGLAPLAEDAPSDAFAVDQLHRHVSNSSSIVATNAAARQGGYSPGGFLMSPNDSLTGRITSGSRSSTGRPDLDSEPFLARHGPGKASVRSVRSTKMSLAEISESEPTSLNKDAFDAADAAPPIDKDTNDHDTTINAMEKSGAGAEARTQSLRRVMMGGDDTGHAAKADPGAHQDQDVDRERPPSSHSVNTFQQAETAFIDFDGVHWQPDVEFDVEAELEQPQLQFGPAVPMANTSKYPTPHFAPAQMLQPRSYVDPETGQQMLYYPARVPAMLNLPPKLSNKQKTDQRQDRRSRILSAMADANVESEMLENQRRHGASESTSWLPDPLAGHRDSFHALTTPRWAGADQEPHAEQPDQVQAQAQAQMQAPEPESEPVAEPSHLRRPNRLSQNDAGNRAARLSRMNNLPPQLRASAFFELPPAAPEIETREAKDGSAMATLESMLDASTHAPVGAFTNHASGGRLGDEVYGAEKKKKSLSHQSKTSTSSHDRTSMAKDPKKRASFLWFRRTSGRTDEQGDSGDRRGSSTLGDVHDETAVSETQGLASSLNGGSVKRPSEDGEAEDAEFEGEEEEDEVGGQPTTLLAELQQRKHQQKQRTQRPNGHVSHMTLLEMDAVAETQRKARQTKRVNLAWEDPNAHRDQNGSDDEDVPLAIIAAKHQGAKNMADLERPIGLMERRDMEDNEPLSSRRARLQGRDPVPSMALPKRQSVATLSAHLGGQVPTPQSLPRSQAVTPVTPEPEEPEEPEEPDLEGETLGERKRRLESKELPRARAVSMAFSSELLSQFGDLDDNKDKASGEGEKENEAPAAVGEEEETLGQRRRRLQAEKQAREREMSYSNLVGSQQVPPTVSRRLSMADMLSAYPKKETDQRRYPTEQQPGSRGRESMMSTMRTQMAGGFRGGTYNDGYGGAQSTSAVNMQGLGPVPMQSRSTTMVDMYGMPMGQQPGYAGNNPYGARPMGNMNPNTYARGSMQFPMQMGAQPQMAPSSMNRVEQWRHGVMP